MNAQELGLTSGQDLFEGDYRAEMSELHQAGYTPWSTEDIIDARNVVTAKHPLWNNYFDTDFGIAGTKKQIHLMPRSERLRAITPQTELTNGGLPFALESAVKTYNKNDLVLRRDLTEEEARASPVWMDFAAGDQNRLDKYVKNTFRFGKDKFKYDTMMGIYVSNDNVERAVVLNGLGNGSQAYGNLHLGSGTRFVGVRRGAPQARAKKSSSPFREDPRSDLERFLSQHEMSREELSGAVELYKTVKKLNL